MNNHPVPQNITSYEFRLVGDMTLKQFFQLGISIGIAVLIYRLPLPGIISVPLAIIAVLVGIALAFVPINGRPFSQWILAFIKAVYSPTEFYWNVTGTIDNTKKVESSIQKVVEPIKVKLPEIDYKVAAKIESSVQKVVEVPTDTSMIDKVVLIKQKPKEEIKEDEVVEINWPPRAISNEKKPVPLDIKHYALNIDSNIPLDTENSTPIPPPPLGQSIVEAPKQVVYVSQPKQTIPVERNIPNSSVTAAPTTKKIISPTNPNILAGLILDSKDQILEGAILEVIDSVSGIPVRALRSNKLGQFQTGSPLSNGKYAIEVEKEGLQFDTVSIEAKGAIIEPIVIKAKY